MDFLQLFFSPKGPLSARSSRGVYLMGRAQTGHSWVFLVVFLGGLSPSANLGKRGGMAICCFLGFVHLLSRKLLLNKKKVSVLGFSALLLGAGEVLCHVPACPCTWKNTTTQPIPSKAMNRLPTPGNNNQRQPFKEGTFLGKINLPGCSRPVTVPANCSRWCQSASTRCTTGTR